MCREVHLYRILGLCPQQRFTLPGFLLVDTCGTNVRAQSLTSEHTARPHETIRPYLKVCRHPFPDGSPQVRLAQTSAPTRTNQNERVDMTYVSNHKSYCIMPSSNLSQIRE